MSDAHDTQHEQLLDDATRTPLWLPLVGAALFFAAAVYLIATRREPPVALDVPAAGAEEGAAEAPPPE